MMEKAILCIYCFPESENPVLPVKLKKKFNQKKN